MKNNIQVLLKTGNILKTKIVFKYLTEETPEDFQQGKKAMKHVVT